MSVVVFTAISPRNTKTLFFNLFRIELKKNNKKKTFSWPSDYNKARKFYNLNLTNYQSDEPSVVLKLFMFPLFDFFNHDLPKRRLLFTRTIHLSFELSPKCFG